MQAAFDRFNRGFEWLSNGYGRLTRRLVQVTGVVLRDLCGLIGVAGFQFARAPTGFIPEQDQGYLITVVQLPPGATLERTEAVVKKAIDIILTTPGIEHVAPFAGLDATTFTVASNAGTIFSGLPSLYNHELKGVTAATVLADLRKRLSVIQDAYVLTIPPPPVQGLGNAGGFKMMLQDRAGLGSEALADAAQALVAAANKDPSFAGVFTLFSTRSPSVYADIDREKAEKVGLTPTDVFTTLQVYLGSQYVNDFNYLGRTYQVIAQADGSFRRDAAGHRAAEGAQRRGRDGADRHGGAAQGRDAPLSRAALQSLSRRPKSWASRRRASPPARRCTGWRSWPTQVLPPGIGFEWTELAFQQQQQGTPTLLVFGAAALFVFLVLAAQYESWKLPLAVVLIVPMCLLASVTGLLAARHADRRPGADRLRGAGRPGRQERDPDRRIRAPGARRQAHTPGEAAVRAARTRLRPILMTSFAFILGVAPLVVATGAGAEMRQSLGTAVFFGMLGVTGFGLLFTPAFYTVVRRIGGRRRTRVEDVIPMTAVDHQAL